MSKTLLRIILHILVWLAVYLLPYLIEYGSVSTATVFRDPGGIIHPVSTALLISYAYLNHYWLVPKLYLKRNYIAYAFLVIAAVLIVIWFPQVFGVFERQGGPRTFGPPRGNFPGGPKPFGISKLSYNVVLFVICTFASISIRQQKQLLEIQKGKLNAGLSFLKAQINPHFLFNTLNSIYALSIQKSNDTPNAIIQLSDLMRYILKESDAEKVPLDRELNYISNYVALQKRRLGNTVRIEYSAPEDIINYKVAPLILMSFIENAFKHGVNPDEDSAINIAISLSNEELRLDVTNNKVKSVNEGETMGIGLKNAKARLAHLYPNTHQLHIENDEKTFSVHLTLQLND